MFIDAFQKYNLIIPHISPIYFIHIQNKFNSSKSNYRLKAVKPYFAYKTATYVV